MEFWSRLTGRSGRLRHLKDPELLDLLLPSVSPEMTGVDTDATMTARAHLSQCDSCRSRSLSLEAFLHDLPDTAEMAFADAFPPERLATQRSRIMRRVRRSLNPVTPGRILRFPAMARPALATVRQAPVWLTAAAAAGLVVGVGVGQLVHVHPEPITETTVVASTSPHEATTSAPSRFTSAPTTSTGADAVNVDDEGPDVDDPFLDQLELVLSGPQVPELSPLDEITPRIREVAVNVW